MQARTWVGQHAARTCPQAALCHATRRHAARRLSVSASTVRTPLAKPFSKVPEPFKGLPWVGAAFQLKLDEIFIDTGREMRAAGSQIMKLTAWGVTAVYLRHPQDVNFVMRHPDRFVKEGAGLEGVHEWLGQGLVTDVDAAHHAAMKELLLPAFRAQSVKDLVPIFVQVGQQLVHILKQAAGSPIDVQDLCRRATLDVIGKAAFGYNFNSLALASCINPDGQQQQQPGAKDPIAVYDALLMPAMLLAFLLPLPRWAIPGIKGYDQGIQDLENIIADMLQVRRSQGVQDGDRSLLAFMLRAQQQQQQQLQGGASGSAAAALVDDKQIRDQLMTFMFAGSDTTATTLAFLMYEFTQHPEAQERAAAEVAAVMGQQANNDPSSWSAEVFQQMPYLAACANETLRLYPAAPQISRVTTRPEVLAGYEVPKGVVLLASFDNMHRNEAVWPRPDEWLPPRWLPEAASQLGPTTQDAFLPFSTGPRACIGRYFAQLELQVLAALVLQQLKLLPVPGFVAHRCQTFSLAARDHLLVNVAPL